MEPGELGHRGHRSTGVCGDLILSGHLLWRVGHASAPLDFTPHRFCRWSHRFDDPQGEFRTLYTALERETCFREVFAPLRPHLKALAQYQESLGLPELTLAGILRRSWLASKALAQGQLAVLSGKLIDLRSMEIRRDLECRYARKLQAYGIVNLDYAELQSRSRELTQFLAGELYRQQEAAGVLYPSNLNGQPCVALFEGRARLEATGEAIPLADLIAEVSPILQEFGILLPH